MANPLSKVNAGALVRYVIDAVHMSTDDADITDEDFAVAMLTLEAMAKQQTGEAEHVGMAAILRVLRTAREWSKR